MTAFNYIEELDKAFKEKIFSSSDHEDRIKEIVLMCVEVITKQPECILGFLRFQSFKQKMLQLLTQSFEIKTGDMLEIFFTSLIGSKYNVLDKNIIDPTDVSIKRKCDQLFENDNEIILVEQKIRDNHDSTKKSGQANNFEQKIDILHKIYPDKLIKSYEWFIDDQFTKNKNFYEKIITDLNQRTNAYNSSYLMYGRELIDTFFDPETWNEFVDAYVNVKLSYVTNISDSIDSYDFDNDPDEIVFKSLIRKRNSMLELFFNDEFKEVRKILFSGNIMSEKIYKQFKDKKSIGITGKKFIENFEKKEAI